MVLAGLSFFLPVSPVSAHSQDAGKDFALAAENGYPTGIWSDGTTMWVADFEDAKLYAYNMSEKTRDAAKDFTLRTGNSLPVGIWSDGTTMWVVDFQDAKLYAYSMATRARDSGKDFDTLRAAGNLHPEDIWSDGTTMWVGDVASDKLYGYSLLEKTRDAGKDFDTLRAAGNGSPIGMWSDGVTMWVVDWRDIKAYAYSMSAKARDPGKDFTLAAGNGHPEGMWSDGTTIWVADREDDMLDGDKLYAYAMPPGVIVDPMSLTVAGLPEGLSGLTDLDAGDNPGTPFTFTAELERRGDDTVVVRLAEGATPFALKVELSARNGDLSAETVTIAAGGSYSDVIEVRAHGHHPVTIEIDSAAFLLPSGDSTSGIRAGRGSAMLMWIGRPLVQREWIQDGPFALHPENADPKSIWSDGETLWVGDESARKVFAYKLWDNPGTAVSEYGTRDPGWDLPSLGDEDFYVTGHGLRLYVAEESLDGASRDVFGYDLTSFTRAEDRDFVYGGLNVAGGVFIVRGTATDGRYMWITNTTSHAHAFRLVDDPGDARGTNTGGRTRPGG